MEKDILSKIAQAFGWLALTAVVASVGFLSDDNAALMVPLFALLLTSAPFSINNFTISVLPWKAAV